jgi:hypothetical protein
MWMSLLLLALQPTVGFSLLSDSLPFFSFFTLLSPPSYSHYLQILFNGLQSIPFRGLPLVLVPIGSHCNILLGVLLVVWIWYDIYLSAVGLTPGGSSTVHIYTQKVHRTTQSTQTIHRKHNSVIRKSADRAPSLRGIPWHLPYNWGKSAGKSQSG